MTRILRGTFVDSAGAAGPDDVAPGLAPGDKTPLARSALGSADGVPARDGVVAPPAQQHPLAGIRHREAGDDPDPALLKELAEARVTHNLRATRADTLATNGAKVAPSDPSWLKSAFAEVGVKETKGAESTKRILEYFDATYQKKGTKGEHTDDSGKANAWCAAFVTWSLAENGIKSGKAVGAREYEKWGEPSEPFRGAVVVLQHGRQKHVAFLVGVDKQGNNVYLGGNQKDQVNVRRLPGYTIVDIRKPKGYEIPPALEALPETVASAETQTR